MKKTRWIATVIGAGMLASGAVGTAAFAASPGGGQQGTGQKAGGNQNQGGNQNPNQPIKPLPLPQPPQPAPAPKCDPADITLDQQPGRHHALVLTVKFAKPGCNDQFGKAVLYSARVHHSDWTQVDVTERGKDGVFSFVVKAEGRTKYKVELIPVKRHHREDAQGSRTRR